MVNIERKMFGNSNQAENLIIGMFHVCQ